MIGEDCDRKSRRAGRAVGGGAVRCRDATGEGSRGTVDAWSLAGLLYCGSGAGLALLRLVRGGPRVRLSHGEFFPLAGAVLAGGIVAPLLLMFGLSSMPASGASLLLNTEAVFTVALAWLVFGENVAGESCWACWRSLPARCC